MKLIIDIPDHIYEWVKNTGKFGLYRFDTAKAIKHGTPLDDVKAEIGDLRNQNLFGIVSNYELLDFVLEILDNIGKDKGGE